jgi:hypothetical protein
MKGIFRRVNSYTSPVPPDLLLDDCLYDFHGPPVDESGILSCKYHSTMVLNAPISLGAWKLCSLVAAVQRRSLTPLT